MSNSVEEMINAVLAGSDPRAAVNEVSVRLKSDDDAKMKELGLSFGSDKRGSYPRDAIVDSRGNAVFILPATGIPDAVSTFLSKIASGEARSEAVNANKVLKSLQKKAFDMIKDIDSIQKKKGDPGMTPDKYDLRKFVGQLDDQIAHSASAAIALGKL